MYIAGNNILSRGNNIIYNSGVYPPAPVIGARPSTAIYTNLNALYYEDNSFQFYPYNVNQNFSYCGWFKGVDTNANASLIGWGQEFSYFIQHYTGTQLMYHSFYNSSTNDIFPSTTDSFSIKWYFVVMSRNKTTGSHILRFYDETSLLHTITGSVDTSNLRSPYSPFRFYLGAPRGRSVSTAFKTQFNSVGFYYKALSTGEMDELWNNGNGLSYLDLTPTQKTDLKAWWDCDVKNGNNGTNDNHTGGFNLTGINSNTSIVSI